MYLGPVVDAHEIDPEYAESLRLIEFNSDKNLSSDKQWIFCPGPWLHFKSRIISEKNVKKPHG